MGIASPEFRTPIKRNPPKDLTTYRLARFLGISTGNLARKLELKAPRAPVTAPDANTSAIAPPPRARLMAGR